jgi:hypothetical protein
MMRAYDRRTVLAAASVLAAGFAGCSGGDDPGTTAPDTGTETPATTTVDTPTRTATRTPTPTSTPTSTATPTPTPAPPEPVEATIDNEGISAWVVTETGGPIAPTDERNPTMTFEVGTRYVIANEGWSAHPFALRRADDTPLLSQSADGIYEDSAAVEWFDGGETIGFTISPDLAAELGYYVCTVHPSMRGDVTTE